MELAPDVPAELSATVGRYFPVEEVALEEGRPTFIVADAPDLADRFWQFRVLMREYGYLPFLRQREDRIVLTLASEPRRAGTNVRLNLLLLAATVVTTFFTAYLGSQRFAELLAQVPTAVLRAGYMPNPVVDGITFSLGLLLILGAHEMGHKIASRVHHIDASWPYFIPFPPLIFGQFSFGTMGAVIMTREPAPDRDGLFDLGASGPLAGILLAIPVLFVGLQRTVVLDLAQVRPFLASLPTLPFYPWIVEELMQRTVHLPPNAIPYTDPLTDAAVVGFLVTGLNLLPGSMLDGGHIARALMGPRWHRLTSYLAVVVLLLMGLLPMALLLWFLLSRGFHQGPLNDVSTPAATRNALGVVLVVILLLALPHPSQYQGFNLLRLLTQLVPFGRS